jgi:WD40 repeat protein
LKVYKKDALCPFCRRPFGLPLPAANEEIAKLVLEINAELNKTAKNNNGGGGDVDDPMDVVVQDSELLALPTDMLCSIMLYLPYDQIGRLSRAAQRLRQVGGDGWLWRVMCHEAYPFVQPEDGNWKKTYVKYVMRGRGWQGGKPGDFKMTALRGHTSWIEVFEMYKNLILSGSNDNTIKMWRSSNPNAQQTFAGHHGAIRDIKFNEVHVVSGSVDCSAKVWDAQNTAVLANLPHPSPVVSVMLDQHNLLTAAEDNRARIFDVRTGNLSSTLDGQHQRIRKASILSNGNHVMTTYDSTVKVWDIRLGNAQCLHTINAGANHSCDIGNDTAIVSDNATIRSLNLNTGAINWTANHQVGDLKADPKHVVLAGGLDVTVLNSTTGQTVRTISKAHSAPINSLQFDDKKIVTAAQDMSIKVWDMANGTSLYALLGGSLQARANNPPHPLRAGCSQVRFDEGKIVASINSLLRVYAFGPSL